MKRKICYGRYNAKLLKPMQHRNKSLKTRKQLLYSY